MDTTIVGMENERERRRAGTRKERYGGSQGNGRESDQGDRPMTEGRLVGNQETVEINGYGNRGKSVR
jgi:hypothetical protein